jgi:hypothetical protein
VVETIRAPGGEWKVEIVRRGDGLLQVLLYHWMEERGPGDEKIAEFWSQQRTAVSITDDLEIARSIGRELLATNDPSFAA